MDHLSCPSSLKTTMAAASICLKPQTTEKPRLAPQLHQALHQLKPGHHKRLVIFIGLYGLAAWGAYDVAANLPKTWNLLVAVPLYLLAAASLHGISLFTHEAVHGVLDGNPNWNRALGILCALPVLQNFSAYRVLHLQHHRNLGLEGDPDYYRNYTHWTWLLYLMHWGRLLIGYPAYIIAIPILGFQQGTWRDRRWIGLELLLLALAVISLWIAPIPRSAIIHSWLMPMICINTMVNIRGMSQHTLLEQASDAVQGTRTILANPVTRFFMCNENYHLEHHLYPAVPWYHLPQLHQALKPELVTRGAPYIPSYIAFVQEFITTGFKRCWANHRPRPQSSG